MLPAILLLGIGAGRRVWMPLPLFLLWPLWLLGWAVWFLLWLVRAPSARPLRYGLNLARHFSGLRVDVESLDDRHVHLRML